ncbi:MAG: 2-C-methyl-D-erythritol 4-phosphate cytidylyltransferase [Ignavibacteriae bacterium]|nr:MAG: 2-C-methyl-D-erythritol 4-phosphate cytidylyltransferase [Ignavibacteriota bacterium]
MNLNVVTIIVAAGIGKRFGGDLPKQFLKLKDKTILQLSIEKFCNSNKIRNIIVVAHKDYLLETKQITDKINTTITIQIIEGGKERQDSVWNGIQEAVKSSPDIILIHDAVRPFVSNALVDKIIEASKTYKAAIPAIQIKDTVKLKEGDFFTKTLNRDTIFAVQTPQGFETSLITSAYKQAFDEQYYSTDDANLVERLGIKVRFVEGEQTNIKITTKEDFELAQFMISQYVNK